MAIGLTGAFRHVLMAEGLSRGDTHVVTPFDFFRLMWAILIGILFPRIGQQSCVDRWRCPNRHCQLHHLAQASDRNFADLRI